MIVPAPPSPRIALLVLSLPLTRTRFGTREEHARPPNHVSICTARTAQRPSQSAVTCLAFNNQLTPRVALPSAPSAHRSNPHS